MIVRLMIGPRTKRAQMTTQDGVRMSVSLTERSAFAIGDKLLVYAEVQLMDGGIDIVAMKRSTDFYNMEESDAKTSRA